MKKEIHHININEIKDPSFLKDLSYKELDVFASDVRDYLIDVTSKNGGHLSSNLGVVDATIALCRVFDFNKDKIIFDVGHQSYTYKLLTGRKLDNLRKKDGVSGFQKMDESNYDHYEAGHSSTSISAALGMAIARDQNKKHYDVISFIGDSSITNGLALEAINNASTLNNKMIIILNDNDMSISKSVGGLAHHLRKISISTFYQKTRRSLRRLSLRSDFFYFFYRVTRKIKDIFVRSIFRGSFLDSLNYSIVGPIDGHNIKEMEKCFNQARKNDKSTIIVIKTIKGRGYKYAEEDKTGKWHGVPSFNRYTGDFYQSSDVTWSQYFSGLLAKKMDHDENTFVIAPGTGYGSGLTRLFDLYPSRIFDVGIAEEHAFVFASGLAVSGKHPTICIYSTFLQRAYDELSHDLARMNLDSTILVDRAGLVGSDGDTHQGIYDEAYLASIPNVTISMPSNTLEANALFLESYNHHGPFAIRFPREVVKKSTDNYVIEYGKWREVLPGKKTAIISVGPVINELKEELVSNKLDVALYNAIYIKPIDKEALKNIANKYQQIIIYDPYSTEAGLPSIIAKELVLLGYQGKVNIKAIGDTFVHHASIVEQRSMFNINVKDIIDLVRN